MLRPLSNNDSIEYDGEAIEAFIIGLRERTLPRRENGADDGKRCL